MEEKNRLGKEFKNRKKRDREKKQSQNCYLGSFPAKNIFNWQREGNLSAFQNFNSWETSWLGLMFLVICVQMTTTHFSVPRVNEFSKRFKRFYRLNINSKRIPSFWFKRCKTFCAKFIIIWSKYNKIILVMRSFRS